MFVVEVADAGLSEDTGVKSEDYAKGGIPALWVADAKAGVVTRCATPASDRFALVEAPAPLSASRAMMTRPAIVAQT
jgi:hypothetical protein